MHCGKGGLIDACYVWLPIDFRNDTVTMTGSVPGHWRSRVGSSPPPATAVTAAIVAVSVAAATIVLNDCPPHMLFRSSTVGPGRALSSEPDSNTPGTAISAAAAGPARAAASAHAYSGTTHQLQACHGAVPWPVHRPAKLQRFQCFQDAAAVGVGDHRCIRAHPVVRLEQHLCRHSLGRGAGNGGLRRRTYVAVGRHFARNSPGGRQEVPAGLRWQCGKHCQVRRKRPNWPRVQLQRATEDDPLQQTVSWRVWRALNMAHGYCSVCAVHTKPPHSLQSLQCANSLIGLILKTKRCRFEIVFSRVRCYNNIAGRAILTQHRA